MRIGIVGCGAVGSMICYRLFDSGLSADISVLDLNEASAQAELVDMKHSAPMLQDANMNLHVVDSSGFRDQDIVIFTAQSSIIRDGLDHEKLDSVAARDALLTVRSSMLSENLKMTKGILDAIFPNNREAIYIVVSNPVDLLTHYFNFYTDRTMTQRILGVSTEIDMSRLHSVVASHYRINHAEVTIPILGEHGENLVPIWSRANVKGVSFANFFGQEDRVGDELLQESLDESYRVFLNKRTTRYAVAATTCRVVESICHNKRKIFYLSHFLENSYGVQNLSLSVPVLVGRSGIERVLELDMTRNENLRFQAAADQVARKVSRQLDI